jgi:hypothetical protein
MSQALFAGVGAGGGIVPLLAALSLTLCGGVVETHVPFGNARDTLHFMFEHWSHCAWVYPR